MKLKRMSPRGAAEKILGKNSETKLLAIIVSALSIYAIGNAIGHTRTFTVPVRVTCDDESTSVLSVEPSRVTVKLRGGEKDIDELDVSRLAAELRVRSGRETDAPTKKLRVTNAGKLRCVGIAEETLKITYDSAATWTVVNFFVKPKLVGTPEQAVAVAEFPDVDQPVKLSGSKKKLDEFRLKGTRLPLEPINVEGKTGDFETETRIQIPADSGIESVEPEKVRVIVRVRSVNMPAVDTPEPVVVKDERQSDEKGADAVPEENAAPAETVSEESADGGSESGGNGRAE